MIADPWQAGLGVRQIAAPLRRAPSTACRKLRRSGAVDARGYRRCTRTDMPNRPARLGHELNRLRRELRGESSALTRHDDTLPA